MDFSIPVDRRGTDSKKWQKYQGQDILPLWVADTDFRSPEAVMQALHQRVEHGVFGYADATPGVVEATCEWLQRRHHWTIEPDWLVWIPGLVTGINVSCRAVAQAGEGVLSMTPVYPPFLSAPGFNQQRLLTVPLHRENGRWVWHRDELEAAITPDTRLLLFCSPHNPTGRVYSREELLELEEIAERHDLIICSDEIHADLVLDPSCQHRPTASVSPILADRTITLMAASKTFNVAGLYCGYAVISNPQLRARFRQAMAGIVPHVNLLGYHASEAAYRLGEDWLEGCLSYLRDNHQVLLEAVNACPGLLMTPVEATYLGWIDTREAQLDDPVKFFEAAGLGVSDGSDFQGHGFVRFNFGCHRDTLQEAIRRLQQAMGQR